MVLLFAYVILLLKCMHALQKILNAQTVQWDMSCGCGVRTRQELYEIPDLWWMLGRRGLKWLSHVIEMAQK
jgi:hypothetical protein